MPSDLIHAVKTRVPEPKLPSVTDEAVADAEASLGFALPSLLRQLYQHVGNGGFGPGYGLLSLTSVGDDQLSLVDVNLELRLIDPNDDTWQWPAGILAYCDWGCNIYSCLDCNKAHNPVLTYEYVRGSVESSFAPTRDSFELWLRDWLARRDVFEPVYEHAPDLDKTVINPFTKDSMVIKGRRPRSP